MSVTLMQLSWFILGLLLILAELLIPSFILMFFGVGAWATVIALWMDPFLSFNDQLLVFLAASVLSLVLFRKRAKGYLKGRITGILASEDRIDAVKGEKAVVITEIKPNSVGGRVEFHGSQWNAEADVHIPVGTTVEVIERKNLVLKVKPLS
jgi:membrane protein implicated in regulation of membrane protease activity